MMQKPQNSEADPRNEQVAFKDAIDVATTFVRNGFGEVIQEVSPDRGTSIYTYDAAGRMASATDARASGSIMCMTSPGAAIEDTDGPSCRRNRRLRL